MKCIKTQIPERFELWTAPLTIRQIGYYNISPIDKVSKQHGQSLSELLLKVGKLQRDNLWSVENYSMLSRYIWATYQS